MTAARLKKYSEGGWGITHFSVWDMKKWSGRYFLVIWEKGKPNTIGYFPVGEQTGEGENEEATDDPA